MSSSKVVCIGPHKRAKDAGLKTTLLTSSLLPRNTYLRFDRSDPLYIKELNAAKVVKKNPDKIYLCEQFDKRKPMALNSFILWTNYNTLQNLKKKLSRTEVEQEEFTGRFEGRASPHPSLCLQTVNFFTMKYKEDFRMLASTFALVGRHEGFHFAHNLASAAYGIKKLTKELKKLENDLKDVKIIDNLWEDVYETEQVVEQGKLDASISLRSKALESRGLLDNFRKINSLKKPKDQQGENKLRLKEEEEKELEGKT